MIMCVCVCVCVCFTCIYDCGLSIGVYYVISGTTESLSCQLY